MTEGSRSFAAFSAKTKATGVRGVRETARVSDAPRSRKRRTPQLAPAARGRGRRDEPRPKARRACSTPPRSSRVPIASPTMPRRVPPRAGTNARRLLSGCLPLALLAVVRAEASPASALDALDSGDRGDCVPDLSPGARRSLCAPSRDAPARSAWRGPTRASRVFPGVGVRRAWTDHLGRCARFEDASSLAAEAREYDARVGACLNDAPTTTHNLYPYAPLPCASVVRRETRDGSGENAFDLFFRREASPRGAKGTSLVVAGLTPGAAYAFRVQTSSAPKDAEDKDAVSGVAVANAQRSRGDPDARDVGVAGLNFYEKDVAATPALRFCGATADAFPNGTALLFSEHTPSAAACCLACAETAGCNAWAHGGRGASFFEKKENEKKENESVAAPDAGEKGACWLMYAPPYEPSTQKTQKNATLTNVTFLSTTPGGGWVGGVLDPSSAAPPAPPGSLWWTRPVDPTRRLWTKTISPSTRTSRTSRSSVCDGRSASRGTPRRRYPRPSPRSARP